MKTTGVAYTLILAMVVTAVAIMAYQRKMNPTHAVTLGASGIAGHLRGVSDAVADNDVIQRVVFSHFDAHPSEPIYLVQATVPATIGLKAIKAEDARMAANKAEILLPKPFITETFSDNSGNSRQSSPTQNR